MQLVMEIQIFALAICVILTSGILVHHAIGDYKWRKVRKVEWSNGRYVRHIAKGNRNHIEDMPKKKKHFWNVVGK